MLLITEKADVYMMKEQTVSYAGEDSYELKRSTSCRNEDYSDPINVYFILEERKYAIHYVPNRSS